MPPIRGPSVATMVKRLHITKDAATKIKAAMNAGRPRAALNLANTAMDGYGVESLYPEFPKFAYVNMGDTYRMTLCYTGRSFYCGSWGDWVERHSRW